MAVLLVLLLPKRVRLGYEGARNNGEETFSSSMRVLYHTSASKAFRKRLQCQISPALRVIHSCSCSDLHAWYSRTHSSCFNSASEGVLFRIAFRMLHTRGLSHWATRPIVRD